MYVLLYFMKTLQRFHSILLKARSLCIQGKGVYPTALHYFRQVSGKFTGWFLKKARCSKLLDNVCHTAIRLDSMGPAWLLRIAAPLISVPTAFISNLSLSFSVVQNQWKSS